MRPRYRKKKPMGGRLATHGRIGGGWSAGTTARRPNCGLFKFLLPRSIEEAALKVFPNGKLRRIMAIRGQRLSTSWLRLKPYAVHDLETKDVGGHFNLSQQNLFALPRLQDDCSNTSQAALSPINPNEQDREPLICRAFKTPPVAGVKHVVVRLSSLIPSTTAKELKFVETNGANGKKKRPDFGSQNCHQLQWNTNSFLWDISRDQQSSSIYACSTLLPTSTISHRIGDQNHIGGERDYLQKGEARNEDKVVGATSSIVIAGTLGALIPPVDKSCCSVEVNRDRLISVCGAGPPALSHSVVSSLDNSRKCSGGVVPMTKDTAVIPMSSPEGNTSCTIVDSQLNTIFRRLIPYKISHCMNGCNMHEARGFLCSVTGQKTNLPEKLHTHATQEARKHPLLAEENTQVAAQARFKERSSTDIQTRTPSDNLISAGRQFWKGTRASNGCGVRRVKSLALPGPKCHLASGSACREPNLSGLQEKAIISPMHSKKMSIADVEAELEAEIQGQLEEEIGKEILILSRKLANLQARYGGKRMLKRGFKAAVLSCPETPLLLEASHLQNEGRPEVLQNRFCSMGMDIADEALQGRLQSTSFLQSRNLESKSFLRPHFGERKSEVNGIPCFRRGGSLGAPTRLPENKTLRHESDCCNPSNFTADLTSNNFQEFSARGQKVPQFQVLTNFTKESLGEILKHKEASVSSCQNEGQAKANDDIANDIFSSEDLNKIEVAYSISNGDHHDSSRHFEWVKTLRSEVKGLHNSTRQGSSSSPPVETMQIMPNCSNIGTAVKQAPEEILLTHHCVADLPKELEADSTTPENKAIDTGGNLSAVDDHESCSLQRDVNVPPSRNGSQMLAKVQKRQLDSSFENRPGKTGKLSINEEDTGFLDTRVALHLLKAGLKRAPSFRKRPGSSPLPANFCSKSESSNYRKDGRRPVSSPFPANSCSKSQSSNYRKDSRSHFQRSQGGLHEFRHPGKDASSCEQVNAKALRIFKGEKKIRLPRKDLQLPHGGELSEQKHVFSNKEEGKVEHEETHEAAGNTKNAGIQEPRHIHELDKEMTLKWQEDRKSYEADYESFVEPSDIRRHQSDEADDGKQSDSSLSREDIARLSNAAVLCLTKTSHPMKTSYVRCIELVVTTGNKNPSQNSSSSRTLENESAHLNPESVAMSQRIDHLQQAIQKPEKGQEADQGNEGCCWHQEQNSVVFENCVDAKVVHDALQKLTTAEKSVQQQETNRDGLIIAVASSSLLEDEALITSVPPFTQIADRVEAEPIVSSGVKSSDITCRRKDGHQLTVSRGELEFQSHTGVTSDLQKTADKTASTASRGRNTNCPSATPPNSGKLLISSVRASSDELTDALEKERLVLPKIKTGNGDMGALLTTSPRDSGCVKRIAEQGKYFDVKKLSTQMPYRVVYQNGNLMQVKFQSSLGNGQHWWKLQQKQAVVF